MRLIPFVAMLGLILSNGNASAQLGSALSRSVSFPIAPAPFGPGEVQRYEVDWGIFSAGEGRLEVMEKMDTVRGVPSYHIGFTMKGGLFFYSVDDYWQSWLGAEKLISMRFDQRQKEGSYRRHRAVDFFLDQGRWTQKNFKKDSPGQVDSEETGDLPSRDPLDDVAFLYFLRTLPLKVGETYTYNRYWKDDGNPVILRVLRKERIKVDAGEFDTIVVRPIIKTKGIFSEGGEAEVFVSDDDRRLIVKLTAKMSVGTLRLSMTGYTPGQSLTTAGRSGDTR